MFSIRLFENVDGDIKQMDSQVWKEKMGLVNTLRLVKTLLENNKKIYKVEITRSD